MSCRFSIIVLSLWHFCHVCTGQEGTIQLSDRERADSLMTLGREYKNGGEYQSAASAYLEAISLYDELKLPYRSGVGYYNLGQTYYSAYEDSLMLRADSMAVELFVKLDSSRQAAMAYNQLGNHMSGIGLNRESLPAYDMATQYSASISDSLSMAFYKNNIGLVLKDLGEYQSAFTYLFESLLLKERHGASDRSISSSFLNIGLVMDYLQKPQEALSYYSQAVVYKKKAGDSLGIARVYSNMAVIHKNQESYDSAIFYIDSSNTLLELYEDDNLLYVNQTNLGNLYKRLGQPEEAETHLLKALNVAEQKGDKNKISDTYQNLGSLAYDQGDARSCVDFNLKALELTLETQSYAQIMEIHLNLQEAYASLGDFKNAHNSAVYSLQYRDSVYRLEQIKAAEELQTKYETQKKEEEISFQKAQLEQQAGIILRNRIIMGILILLSVLGVILVWLWRAKQQRQRALAAKEHEVILREAEMTAIIRSQENERKRFASDLHDGFGQLISVLKLNLGRLNKGNSNERDLRQEVFDQSENVINDMYAELRNICFDLMPQTLVKRGLPAAFRELGERINASGQKAMEVMIFGAEARFPEVMEISLYRITQEWVNNILKYSDASVITLQLIEDESDITLTIEDDGLGFDPEPFYQGKGNGWRNISSRLNLIRGEFILDTHPESRGSMVTINIVKMPAEVPTGTEEKITV